MTRHFPIPIIRTMSTTKKSTEEKTYLPVRLKSVKGISPAVYIPVFYGFLLFLLLFSIMVLPGLVFYGTEMEITTTPPGASVLIDGERAGFTPLTLKIPAGKKIITVNKGWFRAESETRIIKGRLFFSLFFPETESVHLNLESPGKERELLENAYREQSRWSLVPAYTERFPAPSIMKEAVRDSLIAYPESSPHIEEYLKASLRHVTSEQMLKDYLEALILYSSEGQILTPSGVAKALSFIDELIKEYPDFYSFLTYTLPPELSQKMEEEVWYRNWLGEKMKRINKQSEFSEEKTKDIQVGPFNFIHIPASEFLLLGTRRFATAAKSSEFYMASRLVSREEYSLFLKENPYWQKENLKTLIKDNRVDENYLKEDDSDYITSVSWYAAKAWCQWATDYYDIPEGYRMVLPTEKMWYSAAVKKDINDIFTAWQWTSTAYSPVDCFLSDREGNRPEPFSEEAGYTVKGGNLYVDNAVENRGGQEASWCTPFLSFRPVLIKEQ